MTRVTTIGFDVVEHVFQAHGVDAASAIVLAPKREEAANGYLRPRQPCYVA